MVRVAVEGVWFAGLRGLAALMCVHVNRDVRAHAIHIRDGSCLLLPSLDFFILSHGPLSILMSSRNRHMHTLAHSQM